MSKRRWWFVAHGWLALPLWALFCFICVTGTVATVSHELTWLANPDARASNPENLPPRPLPELLAGVEAAMPDARVLRLTRFEPYLVDVFTVSTPERPRVQVYVNRYSGEIQSINTGLTFVGFMRSLHGWLLFPWQNGYSLGYYLVGAMSLIALGALITGVVVYKRFWRAYTRPRLRLRSGARALLGDFHRLAGAWSLWFLLVMGLTGLFYLTQGVLWHNDVVATEPPALIDADELPLVEGKAPDMRPLADALAAARAALPELEPVRVAFPEHSRDYYRIAGTGAGPFFDETALQSHVHPWSGEVVERLAPADMNALQLITHMADPLHFGTLGGLWTKLLWFFFGLVLSALSISGFWIWLQRTTQSASRLSRGAARASRGVIT